jgi:phosphohistidine swiveling domain-containing protein
MQTLQTALARVVGKQEAEKQLRRWLGWGLDTITREMTVQYHRAAREAELRPFFLARFGHRGPGELDLSHPRWVELGDAAFQNMGHASEVQDDSKELEAEFARLPRLRGQVIRQEWEFLKEILELREQWKMEILRPYAHIRWMALELGRRNGLSDSIFWLRLSEILSNGDLATYKHRIDDRKTRFHAFRHLSFPVVTTLGELEGVLNGGPESESTAMEGEGLSSGVAFGEVRVVSDPAAADVANWPAQTILVAEATDPGWTPLFQRAKGVIVEKGGVLSHCAIVAREMALPAVSNIRRIHLRLRDGDRVWVDGSHGRVTRVL